MIFSLSSIVNQLSKFQSSKNMASEAFVSVLIEELASLALQRIEEEMTILVQGVDEDVRKLKTNLEEIQAVLQDAERKQLAEISVRNWLDKLKNVSLEMDDVLDEWNTAILKLKIEREDENVPIQPSKKVRFSITSPFSYFRSKVNRIPMRRDIAKKIKDLSGKLDAIVVEKDRYRLNTTSTERFVERPKTTSFIDETEIQGRGEDMDILVRKLLSEDNTTHLGKGLDIIPIVGMGGIGKTTLAQLAYNNEKVLTHFDKRIWVCVADPFDEVRVAKAIIEAIEGIAPNINELETLLQEVRKGIEGKRFLLILDDVWTRDNKKWEQLNQPLNYGAIGSKVLVTTRKEEVAIMMGATNSMMSLENLSEEHCWLIFKQRAFLGTKEEEYKHLEDIGQKIARKSKGLPLVAKTLGSLMRFKRTKIQWEDVLHSELWRAKTKDGEEIFAPFLLSYYDLSAKEKCCFLYCSIFPKDHIIYKSQLIELWMSQGYLNRSINSEEEGHEYFENLVMRSFFQNLVKSELDDSILSCKMHDIVHDFAQFLTKNECIIMEVDSVDEEKLKPLDGKACHLGLVVGSNSEFPAPNYNKFMGNNLRTLFIVSNKYNSSVDGSLFLQLTRLRTLCLENCGLEALPESISGLIHLRYLNLELNRELQELPDTICDLCNLQTLNLRSCYSLRRLPEGIGKLISLKHLYINLCDALEGLPKGLSRVSCFRRLDTLVVPEHKDKEAYFDIGDFQRLKNLRLDGSFEVKECRNLGNVTEAEKIGLKNSQDVRHIDLDFGLLKKHCGFEDDSAILEGLEPHQNLRILGIQNYMGLNVSPRWMMSLINLRVLILLDCKNCETLPFLGELPSLVKFVANGMASVKKVGVEFFGITKKDDGEDGVSATCRDDVSKSPNQTVLFPKLKFIFFSDLEQWESWEGSLAETKSGLIVMPCLTHLSFWRCHRLQALPDLLQTKTSLKELEIESSNILQDCYKKRMGKEWAKISHIPNIIVNGINIQGDNDVLGTSSSPSE